MSKLRELAKKYDTDKCNKRCFPAGDLLSVYEQVLPPTAFKVLEVGIKAGASLRMWADYFPNAQIYGLDVDSNTMINEGRIHSFQCDQGNEDQLRQVVQKLGTNFDLIIDDGSHEPAHQMLTAKMLMPLLKDGGLYVVEDIWVGHDIRLSDTYPYEFRRLYDRLGNIGEQVLLTWKKEKIDA